jgi:hypothetical protein
MAIKAVQLVLASADVKAFAESLMRTLQNAPEGRRSRTDFHDVSPRGAGFEFALRDWGTWEKRHPQDDDEIDDDWEVMSDHSRAALRDYVNKVLHGLPFKVQIVPEEKNWISFIVFKK